MLCVALAASGIYAITLAHGFVWDDRALILENRYLLEWSRLGTNLTSDFFRKSGDEDSIGYWRPAVTLTYMVDRTLYRDRPWGFHLTNVLLHTAASCLLLAIARRLPLSPSAQLGAALLFAVHPVHVEAVAWIAGRTDLLCAVFFLAAVLLDLDHALSPKPVKRVASIAAGALSILSKEMGAVLPLVIALRGFLLAGATPRDHGRARAAWRAALPYTAVAALYVLIRFGILGIGTPQPYAARAGRAALLWTWWSALIEYARVLLWPVSLNLDLQVDLVRTPLALSVAAGLAIFGLVLAAVVRTWNTRPAPCFALGWMLVGFLPLTNFVLAIQAPVGVAFPWAERYVYLASAGFCLAFGWLVLEAAPARSAAPSRRISAVTIIVFGVLAAAASARTLTRAAEWRSDLTLFGAAVRDTPGHVTPHLNLGVALAEAGHEQEAEAEYLKTLDIAPANFRANFNLGNLYRIRKDYTRAEARYMLAIAAKPNYAQAHLNLGLTFLGAGRAEDALGEFGLADEALRDYPEAKINRAHALRLLGRSMEAIPYYETALRLDPERVEARLGLAGALLETGEGSRGEAMLRDLLHGKPSLAAAHELLALHLEHAGRAVEANVEYREALRLDPGNERLRRRLTVPRPP